MLIFQLYCIWFRSLRLRWLYVGKTSGMFFLFFRLIPTRWYSKGNSLFLLHVARQDRPCSLASFFGRWTSSACLLLQNHQAFVFFWFWPWCCKANIFFPHPLYYDAAKKKNNINSYERRKPPCWGLSQGPLFPSVSFLPFTIAQRGLTAASGTPLQSPHPQPCPQGLPSLPFTLEELLLTSSSGKIPAFLLQKAEK